MDTDTILDSILGISSQEAFDRLLAAGIEFSVLRTSCPRGTTGSPGDRVVRLSKGGGGALRVLVAAETPGPHSL